MSQSPYYLCLEVRTGGVQMGKKRQKYTAEFKRDAVNLVTTQGHGYAEAGRSLGINPNMLSRWQ